MKTALFMASGLAMLVLMSQWADAQAQRPPDRGNAPATVSAAPSTQQKSSVGDSSGRRAADSQSISAMDADLADRVRRSVVSDRNLSTYAAKIKIVSTDRTVHLTGLVQNEGEKAQIGAKAAAIAGRRNVVNDLRVMPVASAGNTRGFLR